MVSTFIEGIPYPGYQPDGVFGAVFNYDKYGTIITILLPGVRGSEIVGVKKAPVTFYLNKMLSAIYLSFDVGRVLEFDCPFSVHRVNPAERHMPNDPGPGMGLLVTIILVDSETGIIRAVRVSTLSRQFSLLFRKLIAQQIEESYDLDSYESDLREIENRYSPEQIRRMALIVYKSK